MTDLTMLLPLIGGVAGLVYLTLTSIRLWGMWGQFQEMRRVKGARAVSFPLYASVVLFSFVVLPYALLIAQADPMGWILFAVSIANIAVAGAILITMLISHRAEIGIDKRMGYALCSLFAGAIVSWSLWKWAQGVGVDYAFLALAFIALYLQTDQTKALWQKGRGNVPLGTVRDVWISTTGMVIYGFVLNKGWAFLVFALLQWLIVTANAVIWLRRETLRRFIHSYAQSQ